MVIGLALACAKARVQNVEGASPSAVLPFQGQFLRIDEGSAVKRFVIGFGAGATELRTQVQIFQVGADGWRPVTKFETIAEGRGSRGQRLASRAAWPSAAWRRPRC